MNKLQGYKSSENLTRYFCSTCGCPTIGKNEGGWEINTGILERLDGLVEFESHIFVEDTLDGGFSDWLLRCHGQPLTRAATWDRELEPGWRHPTTKSLITRSKDRLHAHCDCGGINLYVARPSVTSADTSAPWPDVLVPYHSGPANLNENEPWWLRADKQKFLGGLCTCGSCRLATGCEFTQWAFIPASDISLSADGSIPFSREFGTLKKYRSSKEVTRSFCGTCGATVFWDGDFRPGLLDVAVGLLDAPEGARAESWLEWQTERVSFREATEARATVLVEAVEKDLKAWGKEVQGQQGTAGRFSGKHDGDLQ
ncbi:hypothetical protein MBLNU459_g1164t2 [Dothideomycetes sp. NU459]